MKISRLKVQIMKASGWIIYTKVSIYVWS